MAKLDRGPPVAEAARIDSQLRQTAAALFTPGGRTDRNMRRLQILIERRVALLSPPATSGDRLRSARDELRETSDALKRNLKVNDAVS